MQGPFTQTWVGGRQSRHIPLNTGADGISTRPEEYRILIGDHPDEAVKDGALGMTGPDYGGPYPDTTRPWAIHYRDERAKRPVNLANRKRTSQTAALQHELREALRQACQPCRREVPSSTIHPSSPPRQPRPYE